MIEYIPLGTKVLLKKLPKAEQPPGKILTLNEPKDKLMAQVVDPFHNLINLNDGDIVRYAPYTAHVIDEDNPDYLIVDEKDIWCIVGASK